MWGPHSASSIYSPTSIKGEASAEAVISAEPAEQGVDPTPMSKPVQGKIVASFIFVGVIAAAALSFNMPSIAPQPRPPSEHFDKYRSPYAVDRSSMWKEMDKSIKTVKSGPGGAAACDSDSSAKAVTRAP